MRKKSHEEFVSEIFSICGNEFSVIGKYSGNKTKIEILHNLCGRVREVYPLNFLKFPSCTICNGSIKKDTRSFKKEVLDKTEGEYELIGSYKNNKTPITFKHTLCGNSYISRPDTFISNGGKCPYCTKNTKQTLDTFKYKVFSLVKNEYTVLGDYKGNHCKIEMRHNSCGTVYSVEPNHFLHSGARCPKCRSSKGETAIHNFLTDACVVFKREYKFSNLKGLGGKALPFDFALFKDSKLVCLIEYDGEFHFKETTLNNDLLSTQFHDNLKNEYAYMQNIPLIRIHYKEFSNINSILSSILKEYGF